MKLSGKLFQTALHRLGRVCGKDVPVSIRSLDDGIELSAESAVGTIHTYIPVDDVGPPFACCIDYDQLASIGKTESLTLEFGRSVKFTTDNRRYSGEMTLKPYQEVLKPEIQVTSIVDLKIVKFLQHVNLRQIFSKEDSVCHVVSDASGLRMVVATNMHVAHLRLAMQAPSYSLSAPVAHFALIESIFDEYAAAVTDRALIVSSKEQTTILRLPLVLPEISMREVVDHLKKLTKPTTAFLVDNDSLIQTFERLRAVHESGTKIDFLVSPENEVLVKLASSKGQVCARIDAERISSDHKPIYLNYDIVMDVLRVLPKSGKTKVRFHGVNPLVLVSEFEEASIIYMLCAQEGGKA